MMNLQIILLWNNKGRIVFLKAFGLLIGKFKGTHYVYSMKWNEQVFILTHLIHNPV